LDDTNESGGFVARWCLLAVAAGLVVVTTGLAVSAGIDTLQAAPPSEGVFSDVVWLDESLVYMAVRGHVTPAIGDDRKRPALAFRVGGEPWGAWVSDWGALVQVGYVPDGSHAVGIVGLPHSRWTFTATELILAAPRDQRVALVSAKDILSSWRTKGGQTQVEQIVGELRRSSMIVWICGDDVEGFAQQRRWARHVDDESAFVYVDTRWPIRGMVLRSYLRQAGLAGRDAPVSLVTWDLSLAEVAAGLGIDTHLIVPADFEGPAPRRVRVHDSLRKFKESLNETPISD